MYMPALSSPDIHESKSSRDGREDVFGFVLVFSGFFIKKTLNHCLPT
jgi:hypothetical protein